MPCYYPVSAWRTIGGDVVFAERGDIVASLFLPCGRCVGSKLGAAFTAVTGPIGLIVLAILGAIAAVAALYNKFEGVRRVVNGVGQSFIEFAKLAKNSFSALIEGFALLKEGEFKKAATQFGKSL